MRLSRRVILAVAVLSLGLAPKVAAQSSTGSDRIRISVDGGVQLSSSTFDTSATKTVYLENAVIGTSHTLVRGLAVDGGVSVRLAGDVSIGVTVSSFMEKNDAAVSAAIPHPFFFKTPRTVIGTAAGMRRDELVTHLQGTYTLHPAGKFDVALSAGPSFFRVRQDVVTDVTFTDVYPYDAATFTAASSQRVRGNATGFNVGADVAKRFARHAGIGGGVRFSRAKVSLAVPNNTTAVSVEAGGTTLAAGLRLYF